VPAWSKISHVSFSARDMNECADWFERILGFRRFDATSGDGWSAVLLLHAPTGTVVEFQQHERNDGQRFDPARTGLDHMGFKVDSPAELDAWQAWFEQNAVDHTPTVVRDYGAVLTFRDPDGRQFEMFYRDGHP
jgi:glyoxylase I family protein